MISRRLLRTKLVQILYAYEGLQSDDQNRGSFLRQLDNSITKTHELYCTILALLPQIRKYALERIEIFRQKRLPTYEDLHPNTRFVDNMLIAKLEQSPSLNKYIKDYCISWNETPELVKDIYDHMVESSIYRNYMADPVNDYSKDQKFIIKLINSFILNNNMLAQILEEKSIYWNDDNEVVYGAIFRSLKSVGIDDEFQALDLFTNHDDQDFIHTVFETVLDNSAQYKELINRNIRNWDTDRIAIMDMVIMEAAIAEMTSCPSIPVNVTLNEYIDIAKFYSTSKSGTFINGILDKIASQLREDGTIIKMGRGLLEKQ